MRIKSTAEWGRGQISLASVTAACLLAAVFSGCSWQKTPSSEKHHVTTQQMLQQLEKMLPAGKTTPKKVTSKEDPTLLATGLIFSTQGKSASVSVAIRNSKHVGNGRECPDSAYYPHDNCSKKRLPDGEMLTTIQGPQDQGEPSGLQFSTISIEYGSGEVVLVSQVGKKAEKNDSAQDESLPVSQNQLSSVATSSAWKTMASTLKTSAPANREESSFPTAKEITKTLTSLVPGKVDISDPGGSEGFGHVVIDDGLGPCLIAVNVQRWGPGKSAVRDLFKGSQKIHGTQVKSTKTRPIGNGANAFQWTYDTLRSDGLRVVIAEVNSRAYYLGADRVNPILDYGQLKKIALAEAWVSVGTGG
ncbi:hypothetical protein AB0454_42435 [Streptomyces sp. NPDC093509]|uniref:hypothetical protein n=1 Tax=Streptomyces sp. NPDC093509 TaxID=3154982 RepID=UPI00344CC045